MAASRGQHYHHGVRLLLLLVLLSYPSTTPASAQAPRSFTVLALHLASDDAGSATTNLVLDSTIRDVLHARTHKPVDVFQEFVPFDRLTSEEASLALRDYLRERYRERPPDVVIASSTYVRDFVFRHRDDLFPETPLVVGGAWTSDAIRHAAAGAAVLEKSGTLSETLALALQLHPAVKRAYIIAGRSPGYIPALRADLERKAGRVPLTFIAELSVPEMLDTVKHLPTDSLVFYINYAQEIRGHTLTELQIAELVTQTSPVPVYGFLEAQLGLGIVGGAILTPRNEATQLATLAARVLNGERPQDIPIEPLQLTPIFDWRQLRRWAIDESALPAGSEVRFRQLTIWERYRWLILGALVIIALQAAMIVGLVVQRARRREMQRALKDSEERYALATSAGRVGVWDWDVEAKTIYVDPALKAVLGYPQDDRQPLDDWLRLVHPDDRATVVARMRDHIAGHSPFYELEHRMVHRDGTVFWVLVRGSVATQSGPSMRVVGTITETTERKRAEQKLQEIQAELARIGRLNALGEFAASIAHEVRQPLTAIISSARASMRFLSNGATAEAEQALSYVLDASKRADAVIERNRELFRNRKVQKELLDCNTVVAEAAAMARPKLEGGQVSLVTSLAEHLPTIDGDRIELQQVLLNLIVNAIDAMEPVDPAQRRLEISTALAPSGEVQVSVSDRGIGLGAVDMTKLFRLSYTTKTGGTGVGLSISRSIVEAHGGRLWAEARAGGGATFSFTGPAASATSAGSNAIAV